MFRKNKYIKRSHLSEAKFRDCLGTLFRNSLTVGSLKKINNLFIKDIFHGYCLKRQSLRVIIYYLNPASEVLR